MTATAHMMELQRQLGFTGKDVDGLRGRKTTAEILAAADAGRLTVAPPLVVITAPEPASDIPASGIEKLQGVHKALSAVVHEAATRCDVPFTVIEGVRTAARQKQLVAAGASKTQNSRHLTGHAVDLWPLDPVTMKPLPSDAAFPPGIAAKAASARLWADLRKIAAAMKAAAYAQGVQIEWGGDWGWDAPHFQLNRKAYPT